MLLPSLMLALALAPQDRAESKSDDLRERFENVDTMRRMLVQQIQDHRDAISRVPRAADDEADGKDDRGRAAGNTLADTFVRTRNNYVFDAPIGSDSNYVPGLAAIFNVDVPIKVRIVDIEPDKDEAKKPAETRSGDDEAWEKVANAHGTNAAGFWGQVTKEGKRDETPRQVLRFDPAALKALKETLVDTVARFGGRIGLAHGERIAVVAKLTSGQLIRDESGEETREDRARAANGLVDSGGASYVTDPNSNRLLWALSRGGASTTLARRLILQASADDLRAYRDGDLGRDELLRKIRIDEYDLPARGQLGVSDYSAGGAR